MNRIGNDKTASFNPHSFHQHPPLVSKLPGVLWKGFPVPYKASITTEEKLLKITPSNSTPFYLNL